MAEYDVVIKGGMVFDGTRNPRVRADVAVSDGRVAAVGRIPASSGTRVLDASGLHVAPGFVDLHTHYDAQVFWDPYCTLSGWHGVTSVAIGNCGFGFAPVEPDEREYAMQSMTRVEAIPYDSMRAGLPWDWVSFPEFLDSLQRTPRAVNVLPFVPAGPLLVTVLGRQAAKEGVRPTDDQHRELARLLHEAMDAGGCGWSAQRLPPTGPAAVQRDWDGTPMPTDMMHDETARMLARVLADRNEGVMQMTLTADNVAHDLAPRGGAGFAVGPAAPVQRGAGLRREAAHPSQAARLARSVPGARHTGVRAGGHDRRRVHLLIRGLEPLRRFGSVVRGDHRHLRRAPATRAQRSSSPPALKANLPRIASGPLDAVTILTPASPETERYRQMSTAQAGEMMGKHFVDAFLDIAIADRLQTVFYTASPSGLLGPAPGAGAGSRTCSTESRTAAPTPSSSPPAAIRPRRCRYTSATMSWCPLRRPTGACPPCPPRSPDFGTGAPSGLARRPISLSTTTRTSSRGQAKSPTICRVVNGGGYSGPGGTAGCSSTGISPSRTTSRPTPILAPCSGTEVRGQGGPRRCGRRPPLTVLDPVGAEGIEPPTS